MSEESPEAAGPESLDEVTLAESGVARTVHIRDRQTALAVTRAVCGAVRRLRRPGCQRLLERHASPDGTPLDRALAATGHTREGYLGSMFFYEGSKAPRCAQEGVAATTSPGSHAVFVCPRVFGPLEKDSTRIAETLVIHEMLHSLGLGEGPPSTFEITQSVFHLCP